MGLVRNALCQNYTEKCLSDLYFVFHDYLVIQQTEGSTMNTIYLLTALKMRIFIGKVSYLDMIKANFCI